MKRSPILLSFFKWFPSVYKSRKKREIGDLIINIACLKRRRREGEKKKRGKKKERITRMRSFFFLIIFLHSSTQSKVDNIHLSNRTRNWTTSTIWRDHCRHFDAFSRNWKETKTKRIYEKLFTTAKNDKFRSMELSIKKMKRIIKSSNLLMHRRKELRHSFFMDWQINSV